MISVDLGEDPDHRVNEWGHVKLQEEDDREYRVASNNFNDMNKEEPTNYFTESTHEQTNRELLDALESS